MLPIAMFMARAVRGPEAGNAYARQDRLPSLAQLRKPRPARQVSSPAARPAPQPSCAPSRG
jgi:hypothetical protein